jgi:hypothetical protein
MSTTALILWTAGFAVFIGGFYLALTKSDTDKRVYQSLINIPRFMFYQVLSLLKARGANKRSVATQHYHVGTIDQIIKSDEN